MNGTFLKSSLHPFTFILDNSSLFFQRSNQLHQGFIGIAENHRGFGPDEQVVVNLREAGILASFKHDHRWCCVGMGSREN